MARRITGKGSDDPESSTPPWLSHFRPTDELVTCWLNYWIRRDRGITVEDVGRELGISKARASQLLQDGGRNADRLFRVDAALSAITRDRANEAIHPPTGECDPHVAVYTVAGEEQAEEMGRGMREWLDGMHRWLQLTERSTGSD
jgi:transcriptional regulator with XRE-family HTH domain